MTTHADDMVLVPRAELDALRAENRRLRREAGDREALTRISTQDVRGNPAARSPGGQSGGWRVYLLERLWPAVAAGAWCCGVAARVEVSVICYACVMMPPAARFA